MRIIVTGSRDWTDVDVVGNAIYEYGIRGFGSSDLVVVHGACPTGADAIADAYCANRGIKREPHPANWSAYGNQAGPLRNLEMATAGADLCLAFLKDQSRGTRDMINKAITARIRTVIYPI